jgi:hypothetical protein
MLQNKQAKCERKAELHICRECGSGGGGGGGACVRARAHTCVCVCGGGGVDGQSQRHAPCRGDPVAVDVRVTHDLKWRVGGRDVAVAAAFKLRLLYQVSLNLHVVAHAGRKFCVLLDQIF